MSQTYSTGDLAKLAGVSVRTVQYYDKRGILQPSGLTEGGRRIYRQADLERLKTICFLRDLDFSIEQIRRLLAEDNAPAVLEILLEEHIKELKEESARLKDQLDSSVNLLEQVRKAPNHSFTSLVDLSLTMKNRKSWRRLQFQLAGGIVLLLSIFIPLMYYLDSFNHTGVIKFLAVFVVAAYTVGFHSLIWYYRKQIYYLCPNCHQTFEVSAKEFVLAGHTPRTRKLTCPHCHQKSYCLELAKEK